MSPHGYRCPQYVPARDWPEIAAIKAAAHARKQEELRCFQLVASVPSAAVAVVEHPPCGLWRAAAR